MSLTKVFFRNINTNLTAFSDPITITNFGNIGNRDIGELFDRSQSSESNVSIFWQESTKSFRLAYTSSTGQENANIVVTSNANLRLGNLFADTFNYSNGVSLASGIIGGTNTQVQYNNNGLFAGATGLTTDGTNLTVSGTIFGTQVNAATIGNSGSTITGTISTAAQPNITSLGQLTGLAVAGTVDAITLQAATIGNIGAALLGNGSQITGLTGSQITGAVQNAVTAIYVTGLTGTNVNVALGYVPLDSNGTAVSSGTAQYVTQPIQSNITQVGTLSNLTVNGTINSDTVQASTIGNVGAGFTGATYTASNSFNGPLNGSLGSAGGNTAIVSSLSATSNATVQGLTVNSSAVIGTFLSAYAGIQNTAIGNLTQNTGKFTTLEATSGLNYTIIGNVSPSSATFTFANVQGNVTAGNVFSANYYFANGDPFISGGGFNNIVANFNYVTSSSNSTVSIVGINGVSTNANASSNTLFISTLPGLSGIFDFGSINDPVEFSYDMGFITG